MSNALKALYELQAIDLQIARAQKAKASIDNGAAKLQRVEAAKFAAENADKLLQDTNTRLRDSELELKTIETKQKTFKDKLFSGKVTNPKELSSMEKEIEMLDRQKGKLEEQILTLMDRAEEVKGIHANAHAVLTREKEELTALAKKLKAEHAELAAKIAALTVEREAAVPSVDPVLLKRYEAARVRMGGVVVSKVEDGNCTACHTQLILGTLRAVREDKEIQTCDNCGRMLYLEG